MRRDGPSAELRPLTSLRFAAAMLILLHHSQDLFPWGEVARSGFYRQGVSFFFVLSGFILTHVYSARPTGAGRFLITRAARLWPVHLVTLGLVFVLLRPDSRQFPGTGLFDPLLVLPVNALLLQASVPYISYVFSWNSPSWSISTEWFFYLMFPLLLRNLARSWLWKLALFAGFIALYGMAIAFWNIPENAGPEQLSAMFLTYASPLFRGFEFVLGMSTYLLWQRLDRRLPGRGAAWALEAGALALVLWWVLSGFWAARELVATQLTMTLWINSAGSCGVAAVLIVAMAAGRGPAGQLLSLRPLVWLGEISFAFYMVHQIIMKALYLAALEGRITPASPLLVITLCIGAAAVLHHLVERPARAALLRRFAPPTGRRT